MKINAILEAGVLLFAACLPQVTAQNQTESSKLERVQYKPGQVWTMDDGIAVTVLAIEDAHKVGKVIHVRVDKIPWQTCGDIHLTRAIGHLAVTEKIMQESGLALSRENELLPESSIEAYRKWEGEKKHAVAKVPLQKAIVSQGEMAGPMICNFLPTHT